MALGATLMERGLITQAQLAQALLLQKKSGGRLGEILVGEGTLGYLPLYNALATHHGLPFADLLREPPDPSLFDNLEAHDCLLYKAVPWQKRDGVLWVATAEMSDETARWIRSMFGTNVQIACTSPLDVRRAVERQFGGTFDNHSRLSLWQNQPHRSARITWAQPQARVACILMLLFAVSLAFFPARAALFFVLICQALYTVTMVFKSIVFAYGTDVPTSHASMEQELAKLDEQKLPIYTVLVPMYHETESLPGLLESLRRLDYPASKLDIKLVLEADDHEMLTAAQDAKPHYHFDIIRVPSSEPRTKPKACNYALKFARGEMVTVFDADDRPDRLQLKKAVIAFRHLPPDVACVQARLNYYNAADNLLTRFFSLEYTILFHFMLYGLQRLGIPIPLGGTSNHISIARLRELGEWDPYNVTEDADLGTRLASHGLRTAMLDSYTMEEAPNHALPWIRQRSRWIKGYMQTWLVYMRHPRSLFKALGWKGFLGFQCFVGLSCFTFLSAPVVWIISLLWLYGIAIPNESIIPGWMGILTMVNLLLNLLTHWYFSLYCASMYSKHTLSMLGAALLYPLYLILHSVASYKAFWQLIVKPHFWEKTAHGLAHTIDRLSFEHDMVKSRH